MTLSRATALLVRANFRSGKRVAMSGHYLRPLPGAESAPAPCFGGVVVRDIRLASAREMPAGTTVRLSDSGLPGAVRARVRLPGRDFVELGTVPFIDGVVLLPDEGVFVGGRGIRQDQPSGRE
jgi:hypothetical protein